MSAQPYELRNGNCKELIKQMADNTIDAIVTDPPYELGFMGKKWDATGIAYDAELWAECLRVLKPGGHLLAFSGSRTYHRMAVAIEDAGFDIRDQIMWVYGSGFPKNHDVSKAIDKTNGEMNRKQKFTEYMRSTGITAKQIDEATGTFMGSHYVTCKSQPAIPTLEIWVKIRPLLQNVPEWVDDLIKRIEAEREILETKHDGGNRGVAILGTEAKDYNITAPATDAAKEWNGWGTALKPAHEPICVARKPLIGTVAENVLQYGTGAFNIDGCRVGSEMIKQRIGKNPLKSFSKNALEQNFRPNDYYKNDQETYVSGSPKGRWPANLIHDGSAKVLAGFPETAKDSEHVRDPNGGREGMLKTLKAQPGRVTGYNGPRGSAARFFYCAKASKRDRDEGCGEFKAKFAPTMGNGIGGKEHNPETATPKHNHHPTVKPTELMRYLCRLVTPPNGLILDPFTGSGSTGKSAILEGFRFLGFEMETQYIEIATARIEWAIEQKDKQKTEQENTLFGAENE